MVLSSKAKKEEAELRAIAKKAREVKKAAAARDRKTKERERRQRLKQGLPNESLPSSSEPKPRGRKGIIVLPSEAQEMTARFGGDSKEVVVAAPAKGKAKGKRAGKKGAVTSVAAVASAATEVPAGSVEPPYRVEVHYKRKVLLLDVTLHRVPFQFIDIGATTDDFFTVNTSKYTKKFFLTVPYPNNIKVDASKAEYEFEDGILHCVFPLKNEEIPEELTAKRERIINDIRNQRALRFGTTTDGDLTVRTRRALLAGNEKQQNALNEANKKSKRARVESEDGNEEEEEAATTTTTTTASAEVTPVELPTSSKRKADVKSVAVVAAAANGSKAKKASKMESTLDAAAARVGAAGANNNKSDGAEKKGKKSALMEDNRAMMDIAREAGQKVQLALKEKLAAAQKLHAQRMERMQKRDTRKTSKKEKSQASFERIIGQLRQNVDTTEAQLSSKKPAAQKGKSANKKSDAAAQSSSAPAKRVRFA